MNYDDHMHEPVMVFYYSDLESMSIRPDSRPFKRLDEALRWLKSGATMEQRAYARIRFESDHTEIGPDRVRELWAAIPADDVEHP